MRAAEFSSAMGELAAAFPESNGRIGGELMPYWRAARGPQMMFITALGVLQAIMLLVLLAVCGNTANLVLARASARHREVGVRLALGAGPGSVIRLMLAENLLLGLLGAGVGILIAWWGTEALRAMPPYGAFPVQVSNQPRRPRPRLRGRPWHPQRPAVRRRAGIAARSHRSATGAAQRVASPPAAARCAMA